jgi:hypothetical protein
LGLKKSSLAQGGDSLNRVAWGGGELERARGYSLTTGSPSKSIVARGRAAKRVEPWEREALLAARREASPQAPKFKPREPSSAAPLRALALLWGMAGAGGPPLPGEFGAGEGSPAGGVL